jgi:hypothetical protein
VSTGADRGGRRRGGAWRVLGALAAVALLLGLAGCGSREFDAGAGIYLLAEGTRGGSRWALLAETRSRGGGCVTLSWDGERLAYGCQGDPFNRRRGGSPEFYGAEKEVAEGRHAYFGAVPAGVAKVRLVSEQLVKSDEPPSILNPLGQRRITRTQTVDTIGKPGLPARYWIAFAPPGFTADPRGGTVYLDRNGREVRP